jgi:hypothetical protein
MDVWVVTCNTEDGKDLVCGVHADLDHAKAWCQIATAVDIDWHKALTDSAGYTGDMGGYAIRSQNLGDDGYYWWTVHSRRVVRS